MKQIVAHDTACIVKIEGPNSYLTIKVKEDIDLKIVQMFIEKLWQAFKQKEKISIGQVA